MGVDPQLLLLLVTIGDGDSVAAAVAWLLAHPARILPVLVTNHLSRIQARDAACGIAMDRETWFEIYEAANGCEVA